MSKPLAIRPASSATGLLLAMTIVAAAAEVEVDHFPVPEGAHPHDVAPQPGGGPVWYTAQHQRALGQLDPETGEFASLPSPRSGAAVRQHLGREGEVWAPESGTNTLVRYRLPQAP